MDTCNRINNTNNFPKPDIQEEEIFCIPDLLSLFPEEDYNLHTKEIDTTIQEPETKIQYIQTFKQEIQSLELDDPVLKLTEPVEDNTEQNSLPKPVNQQKLLDTISYIFLDEDKLEEIENYTPQPQLPKKPVKKPKSQSRRRKYSSSIGRLSSKVGLASMMFAGGFAVGGVCSWIVLSSQNAEATSKQHNSLPKPPKPTSAQSNHKKVKNVISTPEVALPESSFALDNTILQQKSEAAVKKIDNKVNLNQPESQPTEAKLLSATTNSSSNPSIQERLITSAELQGRSGWELTLMRNEIYARHGRRFKELKLQRHFESQSWYQPRYAPEEFPSSILSSTELKNAIMIREFQRIHGLLVDV